MIRTLEKEFREGLSRLCRRGRGKRMKKQLRIIVISLVICAIGSAMLMSLTGCRANNESGGNMRAISELKQGDTYAVIKFKDFDEELTFLLFKDIAPIATEEFTVAANNKYYDGKTFHRVLQNMLIQGGALNTDGSDATIPTEDMFEVETNDNARNFHGALCFASDPNTGMNYRQFYIVTADSAVDVDEQAAGIKDALDKAGENDLSAAERKKHEDLHGRLTKFSDAVKERYLEQGGLPLLDGTVTVFGQLVTGWELLQKISDVEVVRGNRIDDNNPVLGNGNGQPSRPLDNIFIETIRIITIEEESE